MRVKKGKGVLCAVVLIAVAYVASVAMPCVAAVRAAEGETTTVAVNAPPYVEGVFEVSIDITNVEDMNSAQLDISFDPNVLDVDDVSDGLIDGETIPIDSWEFIDRDTIRVLIDMEGIEGVSGSGYLAKISFVVVGERGDVSDLDIEGLLVNTEAEEIPAEWIDDRVAVGTGPTVSVDAPPYVEDEFTARININYVEDLNSAQFDISFNASVVNITAVSNGTLDGETIPVDRWEFIDENTVRVLVEISGIKGVKGSGHLAEVTFKVVGERGDVSDIDIEGLLVNTEAEEIPATWVSDEVRVGYAIDTGPGGYPSIAGTHKGTITPHYDITIDKIYTYACEGTGGHIEYVHIWGNGIDVEASWEGYTGDWRTVKFGETFTLEADKTYNYEIRTGSYPQIIHKSKLETEYAEITCTEFTDVNGRTYYDWIPAFKLF